MSPTSLQHCELLMVEDDPNDVLLMRAALRKLPQPESVHLSFVSHGVEALEYLRRDRSFENAPVPDAMLLDLHMPYMDAHRVLREIHRDPRLYMPAVFGFSNSCSESEITRLYDLGATGFISKPQKMDDYRKVLELIRNCGREDCVAA